MIQFNGLNRIEAIVADQLQLYKSGSYSYDEG